MSSREDSTPPSQYGLSVLMPVYNEMATVEAAIRQLLETDLPTDFELIIVDDGSTDGTREFLQEGQWPDEVTVLLHERNRGKGAAVRTALAHARGRFSAIFDADLEYDPKDLGELLTPLLKGHVNAVLGVRAFNGYTSHSFAYVLGNRGVTLATNILFNVYIGDLMSCHKAIRTDVFQSLALRENGFTIEPEIVARLLQRGERIFEVPVHYEARLSNEGKKLNWVDGFRVLRTLFRCRLSASRQTRARRTSDYGTAAGLRTK
jgi:glycosyltransferase involved in cell wall biosynthesis